MITGFNTDVEYHGRVYHVQTEDRGLRHPIVESLVYTAGEIIASRKSPYRDLIDSDDFAEAAVQERMEQQHRELIREIKSGGFDPDEGMPFGHGIVTNRSLDEVVLAFLDDSCALDEIRLDLAEPTTVWEGEPTTLRLKVWDPDTDRPIHGATVVARLVATGSVARELVTAKSDDDGMVELLCEIPALPDSNGAVVCEASMSGTTAELQRLIRKRSETSV